MLVIHQVMDFLPDELGVLAEAARAEGLNIVARLEADWTSGEIRFDQVGEVLLVGRWSGELAAVAGMTRDPHVCAVRMRRLYVAPGFRRRGIARKLALTILKRPETAGRRVTVNAGTTDASAFWEALGFRPVSDQRHTHEWGPQAAP